MIRCPQYKKWTVGGIRVKFVRSHMSHYACHYHYLRQSIVFSGQYYSNMPVISKLQKISRHVVLLGGPTAQCHSM